MTGARVGAVGVLVLALVVVAFLLLRGPKTHEYALLFQNAGQLVKDNDVQVGGRRIGRVKDIELTDDNQAKVTVEVQDEVAPLHEGTSALIRQASLSGVANRYIALIPGPNSAQTLDDGATLTAEKTTTPADLDELFAAFDPKARKALQDFIQGSAAQYSGRGQQANEAAKFFNPALSSSSRVVEQIVADQQVFEDFVVDSSRLVTALAAKKDNLSSLVQSSNQTLGAVAAQDAGLERALDLLPGTLRKSNTTFVNLRTTLDDLDELTDASKPATKDLAPFLRQLRPLLANAEPTVKDIRKLVRQDGGNNDLTDLLQGARALEKVGTPSIQASITAAKASGPVVEFIRPYTTDLVGWLRDFGQGAANYDANGHYVRVTPLFNPLKQGPNGLEVNEQRDATAAGGFVTGQTSRCPGAATQPAADGSSPYQPAQGTTKLDCDPTQVPPGR